jgi:SpoIID/LytB domain protein
VVCPVVLSAGAAVPVARSAAGAPGTYPDSITLTGHGYGHGDGLSQWGSFGYAVDKGWDWTQILAHYYGGTTRFTVDPSSEMTVELSALNDAPATSIVHASVALETSAGTAGEKYSSIVVAETSQNVYRVYGHTGAPICMPKPVVADLDKPTSGWTVVNSAITSKSLETRLTVSVPGIATATTNDPADLIGVCMPDGSVRSYRGAIQVMNGTAGENRTVNAVPLDAYLRGVVPSESIPSWGDSGGGKGANALRAQAVAARTYSLASRRGTFAQTCDTGQCQVYGGMAKRSSLSAAYDRTEDPRTDAAVLATAGVVLNTAAGVPAFTQFSSSSGGFTSGANFPAVEDLGDAVAGNASHTWTATVTRAAIEKSFAVGTLQGIEVVSRNGLGDFGGRVKTMRLRGTTASLTVTGEQFRSALGLKSAWFFLPGTCDPAPVGAPRAGAPSLFHSVTPTRIVDTRSGIGGAHPAGACTFVIHVAGVAGVPTDATSVTANITVVGGAAAGFATVFPCDQGRPASSNVNIRPSLAVANLATVAIDRAGDICAFLDASADLLVDVLGWAGPTGSGGARLALKPARRVADTRNTSMLKTDVPLAVAIPADLRLGNSVLLNVTATQSGGAGFVTVYPCDAPQPPTSNLNMVVGRDIANQVVAPVGADGNVCFASSQPTHLVVDLVGALTDRPGEGASLVVSAPERIFDSRSLVRLAPGRTTRVSIPTQPGQTAPAAVLINLTGTDATSAGFVTAYSCSDPEPPTSNLNVTVGVDVANVATVSVEATSVQICLISSASTHLVVDLLGRLVA